MRGRSFSSMLNFSFFLQTNRASRNPNTLVMVIFIAMAICFVAASFVTFIVNEKTSKVSTYMTCKTMFKFHSKNTRTSIIWSEVTYRNTSRNTAAVFCMSLSLSLRKISFWFCHCLSLQ